MVTTPQHRKGSKYERDVRDYERERGYPVERCYGAGRADDVGDICGLPDFAQETKDHREFRLSEWLTETERERQNAGKKYGVLVVKRKQKPVAESYAVMPLRQLVDIVDELQQLRGWMLGAGEAVAAMGSPE